MRRAGVALVALLTGALLLLGGSSARAQDGESAISIRQVDSTDPAAVEVTFFYSGDREAVGDLTVREDGDVVQTTPAVPLDDQQSLGVVLAIDSSLSMNEDALIERVREAAHSFVDGKAATDQIAIVTFDRNATLVEDFTADADQLNEALDSIALEEGTAVWDAIVRAARLYEDSSLQPNIIVFTDGEDVHSVNTPEQAEAAVRAVGGTVFAVGVDNPGFDRLSDIAELTGGSATVADNAQGVGDLFTAVQETLRKQYVVTFASESTSTSAIPITLSVGNDQATVEYTSGSNQEGAASLRPVPVEKPGGPSFLRSPAGLAIGLGLVALALVGVAFMVGSAFFGREPTLGQALSPYADQYVAAGDDLDDGDKAGPLTQTPILQRAVEATGSFAEQRGILTKVEGLLERANLPLRPAEALFFYLVVIALAALLLFAFAGGFIALIGVFVLALVPPAILSFLANRRRKAFESLLPDTLQLMASTLRAGYSLMQGVEAVSQEVSEPMGRELRRVVTEARLGRPLEEALDGVAERMGSADFSWAVMAIRIQREVGGNLAELLVTVAETMTERERLRRDVNALTAEGKISAIVLGILPIGLGGFIFSINPDYMKPLFEETMGKFMLGGSILLALAGFYWMKKTIEVEV